MPFRLTTLLLLLVVLGSSLAAFGQYGISVSILVVLTAISVALSWWILLTLVMLLEFITIPDLIVYALLESGVQWHNGLALTVWIASVTILLHQADATRRNRTAPPVETNHIRESEQTPNQQQRKSKPTGRGSLVMPFRLTTLLLLLAVLGFSLAVFGLASIVVFTYVASLAVCIARSRSFLLGILLAPLLIVLGMWANFDSRESVRRASCGHQIRQIALALYCYHEKHGHFPPAYIADKNGKPMHSWRVLILPYTECDDLYKRYNFNEPWNGPNNCKLIKERAWTYACPNDKHAYTSTATNTNYVAVVGTNAAWSGEKCLTFADIAPASNTIMLVEVTDAGIPWLEPRDLILDSFATTSDQVTPSSQHTPQSDFFFHYAPKHGAHVATADGAVYFLPSELFDSKKYPDLLKIGGFKKEYQDEAWPNAAPRIHWPNCLAFTAWLVSIGLLLHRAIQAGRKRHTESRAGEGIADDDQGVASSST
jgi:hypothetical protein